MKPSMLFFALAIILGILFASSILWSRCGREKYGRLPPLIYKEMGEDVEPQVFTSAQPRGTSGSTIIHDYLH